MIKILMVDDEADLDLLVQQRFRKEIREGTYGFLFARHGHEALEVLEKAPDINVVITDINMPEMNGYQLLLQLRKNRPDLHILVLSAYTDTETVSMAMKSGASAFITKPIDFKDMEEKINACRK